MATAPDPQVSDGTITAEQLCSWTGLTDRRHRQIAAKGFFPPPILGRYQAGKTLIGMVKYLAEMVRKKDDKQARQQLRLTKAKADLALEELSEVRGKNVEKAVIGPALRNVSVNQKAVLQRRFEQELLPKLANLTTLEMLPLIQAAVDEVVCIFREGVGGWIENPPADEVPKPI